MASRPGPYPLNVRLGVRLCRWDLHGHPGEPPPNTGPATARRQGLKARERKAPPVRHTRPAAQSKSRRSLPVPVLPRTPPTGSLPRLATPGPDPAAAPQTAHRPLSLRRTFSNRSRAAAPPRPRALARRAAATSVCAYKIRCRIRRPETRPAPATTVRLDAFQEARWLMHPDTTAPGSRRGIFSLCICNRKESVPKAPSRLALRTCGPPPSKAQNSIC
nr:uncharacterized protein LOC118968308 isoform X2 [Manis javanica]